MNKPQSTPTRTCSICGLQKPLSAFLRLSGASATYAIVCADCAQAGLDKITPKDTEESTRSTTSVTIDSKSKVKSEVDKREAHQKTEEEYHEEQDKNEEITLEKSEKTEDIAKQEKKHRQTFLQTSTFLTTPKKTDTKIAAESRRTIERAAQQAHGILQTKQQEIAAKAEQSEKEIDYANGPFVDTQISGKEKFTKGIAAKEGVVAKEGMLSKAKFVSWAKPASQPNEPGAKQSDEKILSDYIDKNMGPGSRKK